MNLETRLYTALDTATAPELAAALVAYGYIEQTDEKEPSPVPFVVVRRTTTEFISDMCGTRPECWVNCEVVTVARGQNEVRRLAQVVRQTLTAAELTPFATEAEEYDPDLRAWGVVLSFRDFDSNPDVFS